LDGNSLVGFSGTVAGIEDGLNFSTSGEIRLLAFTVSPTSV